MRAVTLPTEIEKGRVTGGIDRSLSGSITPSASYRRVPPDAIEYVPFGDKREINH